MTDSLIQKKEIKYFDESRWMGRMRTKQLRVYSLLFYPRSVPNEYPRPLTKSSQFVQRTISHLNPRSNLSLSVLLNGQKKN